jgi:hypothetical protein
MQLSDTSNAHDLKNDRAARHDEHGTEVEGVNPRTSLGVRLGERGRRALLDAAVPVQLHPWVPDHPKLLGRDAFVALALRQRVVAPHRRRHHLALLPVPEPVRVVVVRRHGHEPATLRALGRERQAQDVPAP